MASQITSLTIVYSIVYSGAHHRKHQSSASLPFDRWSLNSPYKWPLTRKRFSFDDVIMMARSAQFSKYCQHRPKARVTNILRSQLRLYASICATTIQVLKKRSLQFLHTFYAWDCKEREYNETYVAFWIVIKKVSVNKLDDLDVEWSFSTSYLQSHNFKYILT